MGVAGKYSKATVGGARGSDYSVSPASFRQIYVFSALRFIGPLPVSIRESALMH